MNTGFSTFNLFLKFQVTVVLPKEIGAEKLHIFYSICNFRKIAYIAQNKNHDMIKKNIFIILSPPPFSIMSFNVIF